MKTIHPYDPLSLGTSGSARFDSHGIQFQDALDFCRHPVQFGKSVKRVVYS
jgi:hypothetical protein